MKPSRVYVIFPSSDYFKPGTIFENLKRYTELLFSFLRLFQIRMYVVLQRFGIEEDLTAYPGPSCF